MLAPLGGQRRVAPCPPFEAVLAMVGTLRFAHPPNESEYDFAISRRVSPEVCIFVGPLSKSRAQGRPGARCTRGLACICAHKNAHTSIQVQRKHSGLPCAVALRVTSCSPQRTALLPLSSPRSLLPRNLTPAPRRQDHTTSPYASCHPRLAGAIRVHRIPPQRS